MSIPTEAEALATFQDGLVTSIQLLKGNNGDFLGGEGYRDYRKLTGTVSIRDGSDLLIGNETEFFKELVIGQPLLLVEESKIINKQNYLRFAPLSFQSNAELIFGQAIRPERKRRNENLRLVYLRYGDCFGWWHGNLLDPDQFTPRI